MKMMTGLFILVSSIQAFAGPEEHLAAQVCYVANSAQASIAEICLETVSVDVSENKIAIYSYFQQNQNLFNDMKVNYLARKNEDFYNFRASNILKADSCTATLNINGQVDNYGDVNTSYLEISMNESCGKDSSVVKYNLK
jgi:hypothetical protein